MSLPKGLDFDYIYWLYCFSIFNFIGSILIAILSFPLLFCVRFAYFLVL